MSFSQILTTYAWLKLTGKSYTYPVSHKIDVLRSEVLVLVKKNDGCWYKLTVGEIGLLL